jgi:ribose transport system substrate-binding protein
MGTQRKVRRSPRIALAAALTAALAVGATGCGSDASTGGGSGSTGTVAKDKTVQLAFFGLAAANAYTQYAYKAAQAEAKEQNAQITFFDGNFDGATQAKQIQDATTSKKFQGYIIMPNDQPGVVPAVSQAIQSGVKVTALQFPIGSDPKTAEPQVKGITSSIIEDVVTGAKVTAEGINAMCKDRDPCNVGILWGSRDKVTWDGPAKRPTLMDSLDPNVKVVAEADGGFLQADGEKATSDMLQAHPDLDVLATPSGDQMTIGGERAIAKAGKKLGLGDRPKGEIAIVGYGASSDGVEKVAEGTWYQTYALVPGTMARKAVDVTVAAVRGETVTDVAVVQTDISPIGANVTQATLKAHPDFKAEWTG